MFERGLHGDAGKCLSILHPPIRAMASTLQLPAWETTTGESSNLLKRRGAGQTQQGAFFFLLVFSGIKLDGIILGEILSVKDVKRKGWMTGNCQLSSSDQISQILSGKYQQEN